MYHCCNNDGGKIGMMAKIFIDTREVLETNQLEIVKLIGVVCM